MSDCKSWRKTVMGRIQSGPLQNGVLLTDEEHRKVHGLGGDIVLTDEERDAVEAAAAWFRASGNQRAMRDADALCGLLARCGHDSPLPAPPTNAK